MAKVLGGVRRPKAVCGILVGLLGLLVTVGPPAGGAELAPTMPPTPPIELRSPVAPEAGIRSVDYDSWIGPHVINVMPGGTELEFIGGIGGSASAELARALDANPGVHVLQLTSQGGNTLLAMDMELLVRSRGLVTYVPRFCASACAFVFLGGKQRYVGPGAKLGFHAAVGFEDSPEETAHLAASVKTWMLGRGVAPAFVERAVSTPHTTVWEPTPDQLLQARVITALGSPQRFATPSFGPGIPALVRQGPPQGDPLYLATQKLMLAIRKADPASYDQMQAKIYEAMRAGTYDPGRAASVSRLVQQVLRHCIAVADDDAVAGMVSAAVAEQERLAIIDPAVCLKSSSVTPSQRDAAMDALPPDLRVREITAITMVVETGTSHPQAPPSLDEARAIYTVLLRNLVNVFGDDTKYLIHPDLDPSRTCAYRNAVLKSVLGLGAHDRSVLLRAMMLGQLS